MRESERQVQRRGQRHRGQDVGDLGDLLADLGLADTLELLHPDRHLDQPLVRVGQLDGQLGEDGRDPVVEGAALVGSAYRDRDQGPDAAGRRLLAAAEEQVAERAGHDGEDDVVEGAAQPLVDREHGVEVDLGPPVPAVPPDRSDQGRGRRRAGVAGEAGEPARRSAERPDRRPRMPQAVDHATGEGDRGCPELPGAQADAVADRTGEPDARQRAPAAGATGRRRGPTGRCPSVSSMVPSRSVPAMPSTIVWWTLVSSAHRSSASPSMIQSCHRGRSWSSGSQSSCSTTTCSASSSPGAATAARRTCWWRTKSGSSTHTGRPRRTAPSSAVAGGAGPAAASARSLRRLPGGPGPVRRKRQAGDVKRGRTDSRRGGRLSRAHPFVPCLMLTPSRRRLGAKVVGPGDVGPLPGGGAVPGDRQPRQPAAAGH